MAYVITRLCQDCVDGACVDCIVVERPCDEPNLPPQPFIDPEGCICCAACEPACPAEAIFDEDDVPATMTEDAALNSAVASRRSDFVVPTANVLEALRARTPKKDP